MSRREHCARCANELVQPAGRGRPRTFCSKACKQSEYRARRRNALLNKSAVSESRVIQLTPPELRRLRVEIDRCKRARLARAAA
jgi:hypothetical protein